MLAWPVFLSRALASDGGNLANKHRPFSVPLTLYECLPIAFRAQRALISGLEAALALYAVQFPWRVHQSGQVVTNTIKQPPKCLQNHAVGRKMSARVPLITFAIINLLYLAERAAEVQCQIADYSEPQVGAAPPDRWQPSEQQQQQQAPEQNMERAKEQQQQGLQLILSKLIPSLWPIQYEQSQQSQPSSTANQYQEQSYQQLWQQAAPISQLGVGVDATPQPSPTRQLVSAHSNQLFYPPGEQAEAAGRPQVEQPAPYRPALSANHYSNYPAQQQQQQQQQYQSVSAWQPPGAAQSMAGYRPAPPPASPAYQPAEWPASQWAQTVPARAGLAAPQMSATQAQAGAGSALLSFLANNKANLSNLIQLLPLIAQTLSILPRVFHSSAAHSASGSAAPAASLLAEGSPSSAASASLGELASQSVLSLLQSGASSNHSERISERLQAAGASSTAADNNESADNNQAKRPGRPNELSLSQPSVTGSLFGEFLPQITRHLLASLLQAASQPAAELAGQQKLQGPLVSYLLEPAAPAGPPTRPAGPSSGSGTLGWLRSLIGSLASSASRAGSGAADRRQKPAPAGAGQPAGDASARWPALANLWTPSWSRTGNNNNDYYNPLKSAWRAASRQN